MQALQFLLLLVCSALAATSIIALSSFSRSDLEGKSRYDPLHDGDGLRSFFSFQSPVSFFSPTATISLTDDNSTFFVARPAAFGPTLSRRGLSGQLWIGSGFGEVNMKQSDVTAGPEGELGCTDVLGWTDEAAKLNAEIPHQMSSEIYTSTHIASLDGTAAEDLRSGLRTVDARLRYSLTDSESDSLNARHANSRADAVNDLLSRSTNDIGGKIVLLSRGGCGFSEKVEWAQRRGAVAVIVGDNVPGGPLVRMYAKGDTSNITIPSLFTSHTTAHLLSSLIPSHMVTIPPISEAHIPYQQDQSTDAPQSVSLDAPGSNSATATSETDIRFAKLSRQRNNTKHEGLWVTLTPSDINSSPFFHTLFVLVVSPLLTLIIVYSMLLLRSRIRRRRWRAPKSVVERLPVRVYHTFSTSSSSTALDAAQESSTSRTPLLHDTRRPINEIRTKSQAVSNSPTATAPPSPEASEIVRSDSEKSDPGLSEWRRRYRGRQKECVVCLDEYVDGVSRVMSLPCGHEFHVDCITPWLTTRRRTCPICKGDVVRSLNRRAATTAESMLATDSDLDNPIRQAHGLDDSSVSERMSGAMPMARPALIGTNEYEPINSAGSSISDASQWLSRHVNRGLDFVRRLSPLQRNYEQLPTQRNAGSTRAEDTFDRDR